MTQEINDVACDPDIYKYGVSQGMFDMPKQRANEYCKELTEQSGRKHDWHYFGGRVHVLALPKSVESLLIERAALKAAQEWRGMESAPKDQRILVRCKNETYVAHWSERRNAWMCSPDWSVEPTNWMPLPTPPQEQSHED